MSRADYLTPTRAVVGVRGTRHLQKRKGRRRRNCITARFQEEEEEEEEEGLFKADAVKEEEGLHVFIANAVTVNEQDSERRRRRAKFIRKQCPLGQVYRLTRLG